MNRAALPDGYEVPLHRSLTEPMMMGGAPRTVAISVGTLAAAVGIGLQLWFAGAGIWLSATCSRCGRRASSRSSRRCSPATSSIAASWTREAAC